MSTRTGNSSNRLRSSWLQIPAMPNTRKWRESCRRQGSTTSLHNGRRLFGLALQGALPCGVTCPLKTNVPPKLLLLVIGLTEELLAAARQSELAGTGPKIDVLVSAHNHQSRIGLNSDEASNESDGIANRFTVGDKIQAVWSDDGEWYDATVEGITANGYYVSYDGWGNKEEVDFANVRQRQEGAVDALLEAEKQAEATKQAIKRKIAQAADVDILSRDLPPKFRVNPDDPEDVKAAKRKKIHAFKSKLRREQLEVNQNKRQNAWQQFQTTKGKSRKIGFFSGRKRESIFKSPDDPKGKVGVTGSGKGVTEFQKREKHLHLKDGLEEGDD